MSLPLGQPVTLTFLTYSDAAQTVPADATTVSVDILDPVGVTTTYTLAGAQVVHASTGTYTLAYLPAIPGHYALHWLSTGAVATALDGEFDVDPEYGRVTVTVTEFKDYLNDQNINAARAGMILDLAQHLCESVVTPLPSGAEAVVLDIAGRAYAVPPEGVGPYATPPVPGSVGGGGLWLTPTNEATLRRLAGQRHEPVGVFPCAQRWPDEARAYPNTLTWPDRLAWDPNL